MEARRLAIAAALREVERTASRDDDVTYRYTGQRRVVRIADLERRVRTLDERLDDVTARLASVETTLLESAWERQRDRDRLATDPDAGDPVGAEPRAGAPGAADRYDNAGDDDIADDIADEIDGEIDGDTDERPRVVVPPVGDVASAGEMSAVAARVLFGD